MSQYSFDTADTFFENITFEILKRLIMMDVVSNVPKSIQMRSRTSQTLIGVYSLL